MPFPRATLSQLRAQVAADIEAELPGVDVLLRYSNLGIIGSVLAALANGMMGYLDWIALQSTPFTCTDEALEGWAALKGEVRKPATAATGTVTFGAAGGMIQAGTPVSRSDGVGYVTTSDATAVNGTVIAPVAASVTGAIGNTDPGTAFSLGAGIAGVASTGYSTAAITGGADIETDAELRSRMLIAYAAPAQGGSIADYAGWALAVPGVTRAWIKPAAMGPGTLAIFFMMDAGERGHGGFPQGTNGCGSYESRDTSATGDQLAVANAVFGLQSVTALVYAVAPIPNTLTLTIAGMAGASTTLKAAVSAAVAAALLSDAVPGGLTNVSSIEAAIAAVPGTSGFVITGIACSAGTITPGAAGNISSDAGALPVLGEITWA
ncbi:baseplate J/gp47 family protein [Sphingomonas bacterium]|uniref:baseplate J/gp47 family protein n=1 Tax=Sphingomonas bacterium TaxID=1895847 RepID=UPI001575C7A8|nr:baseplate J/gp47 family protein [Sphingomonas bacterium]